MADLGKTTSGMQPSFAALLADTFWLITGLVFLLTEKDNRSVRFHAMQAICMTLAYAVVSFGLAFLPVIGAIAAQQVGGIAWQLATHSFWGRSSIG